MMPTPTPEHRRLEPFAGMWTGTEHMHPSPWDATGGPAEADVVNVLALDGFAIVQDYAQRRGGQPSLKGHGVLRWDDMAKQYSFTWFDSMGMSPAPFVGQWEGDTLSLSSKGPFGIARAHWTFGDGTYTYRMELSQDGQQWVPFMNGQYTRKA